MRSTHRTYSDAGTGPGPSTDPLSSVTSLLRVRPQLQKLCRLDAQWASDHPPEPGRWAPFHFVLKGRCVVQLNASETAINLYAGDILVLPHGSGHVLRGATTPAGARGPFGIHSERLGTIELKSNANGTADAEFICGRLGFDSACENLVLAGLPDVICVSSANDEKLAASLSSLMYSIREEIVNARAGATAIATNLASALFVMVIRAHLDCQAQKGALLGLLANPQISRSVMAMLNDPARSWTLDQLAAHARVSRASFVRMFRRAAQMSPLTFLTELRLGLAMRKLSATSVPVAMIAGEAGYESESTFSRAFYRRFGIRPGAARAGAFIRRKMVGAGPTDSTHRRSFDKQAHRGK